ncbi:hypothetical protein ACHAXR_003883 [Thalassiosira sp. AJA248-18]
MRVYDVESDGTFAPEGEQNDRRRTQRPSNSHTFESSHTHRYGVASESMGRFTRDMLQQSHSSLRDDGGWGRQRSFSPASFGSSLPSLAGYGASQPHPISQNNAYLSQLLQSMSSRHNGVFGQMHGLGENVDNMSYERLLEVFGDGSENRGASSQAIASLPVSRIGDPERDLPEDRRQCSICLEDFCRDDKRTSLPCLHGFHEACVNRWLSSNGTCPVCKTSVGGPP